MTCESSNTSSFEPKKGEKEVKQLIRKGYVFVNEEVVYDDDYRVNEDVDSALIEIEFFDKLCIPENKDKIRLRIFHLWLSYMQTFQLCRVKLLL